MVGQPALKKIDGGSRRAGAPAAGPAPIKDHENHNLFLLMAAMFRVTDNTTSFLHTHTY